MDRDPHVVALHAALAGGDSSAAGPLIDRLMELGVPELVARDTATRVAQRTLRGELVWSVFCDVDVSGSTINGRPRCYGWHVVLLRSVADPVTAVLHWQAERIVLLRSACSTAESAFGLGLQHEDLQALRCRSDARHGDVCP